MTRETIRVTGPAARLALGAALATAVCLPASSSSGAGHGPYNARFLAGGEGIGEPLAGNDPVLEARASWTLHTWMRTAQLVAEETQSPQPGPEETQLGPRAVMIGGVGDPAGGDGRFLGLLDGRPALWLAAHKPLVAPTRVAASRWVFLAATFDGERARLFVDGREVAQHAATIPRAAPRLQLAPVDAGRDRPHFGGELAAFTLQPRALTSGEVAGLHAAPPDFELIAFAEISVGWPWQVKQLAGLALPQSPATLPKSAAPFAKPRAIAPDTGPKLRPVADRSDAWTLHGWRLAAEPRVAGDAAAISLAGYDDTQWHPATVPGTVLTTLIDRGVYPDPDYGLNNLAIPESLNRQHYWYRTELEVPEALATRRLLLTFGGINYRAEVWLNGARLGEIRGAFIRGRFDVTSILRRGRNALAVRVSPPPHPGIPHEQSLKAGPGENGGALALDGPTFIATEGWDWIPAIRDRNTGLWQDVVLSANDAVRLGDPQVITRLPLPDIDRAQLEISVPLENLADAPVRGVLRASFDDVTVTHATLLEPGATTVKLTPSQHAALHLVRPRLWWPNGYGKPELYTLRLSFAIDGRESDARTVRFGVRHVTYELSLFDETGHLRRVEVDPASAAARGERLVDVRHEALKKSPRGWAASLYPGAMRSSALRRIADESLTPHLAIKVNGLRIAARGGNWGMDDSRKRISRARLEPYFRLHARANLNTIRNWVGLNTEDVFFDLADEHGLLVLSDFWASTQDFQVEPEDPALFLANARDVIQRYRNHPSIVLWFGRNEGVPQPILNSGLADLVAELDGTRHFTGSSNRVNLQGSGPYNYRPPVQYFNELAQGFSVEVGTPSLATLESIRAWTPATDQWPSSDVLAYHDWHHGGNGDVATFMATLGAQFGAATSLEDFERKAQLMNYVTHRALFEGFHAHLWTKNSGRLLWMTHPAWPSHAWQIYSSDYDTHAAYYGVLKACEPVHVQMNLPDFRLAVINTTRTARAGLTLRARVFAPDLRLLHEQREGIDAAANTTVQSAALALDSHLAVHGLVFVKLELSDADGNLVSENFYWQARAAESHRILETLPAVRAQGSAAAQVSAAQPRVRVTLRNPSDTVLLATKLTLLDARGARILPAYYSDNYFTLLPGETRTIDIDHAPAAGTAARVAARGWNLVPGTFAVRRSD